MTFKEKVLYHQIHPIKLFTDWSTGIIALYFFWQHEITLALVIAFLPAVPISFLLVKYGDLEPLKKSSFGKYIKKYMTRQMEAVRLVGYLPMMVGGWYHSPSLIIVGLLIVLFGWLKGLVFR